MSETDHTSGCWFHTGLVAMYEDKRYCDIQITVQSHTFNCHKIILMAASKYFDTMFSSGMKEASSDSIDIKEVSPEIFGALVSFIYSGHISINTENVEAILHAACCFQIIPLRNKCELFLNDHITAENGVSLWCTARAYTCDKLCTKSYQFILDNFDQVAGHDELVKVDCEDIIRLINDDDLNVDQEETVCMAAMRWLHHDVERRKQYITDIIRAFRLNQLSMDFILEELLCNPIIRDNDKCIQLLKSAIKYHTMPEMRHTTSSLKTRLRNSTPKTALTLVLGKRPSEDFSEVIGFCVKTQKWVSLCTAPIETGDGYAACPVGNDVYVSGGTKKPMCMFQFSAKLFRWVEKTPMSERRSKHSMVALGSCLYALGGYNFHTLGSVEEFDMQTNTWASVGKLTHPVAGTSATVVEGNIYIFGGWHGLSEDTSIIQCYSPATHQCTVIGHLPSPHMDTRALTVENSTYIVGTGGEVYLFEKDNKVEMVNKLPEFSKKDFGLFSDDNTLYCVGGEDGSTNDDDSEDKEIPGTEILNVLQNGTCTDSLPDNLPVPMEVYCCYKSVLIPKYPLVSFSDGLYYT